MDNGLIYYLQNTAITKAAIESRLTHPITKLRYPTRSAYVLLKKYASDFLTAGAEPRFISLAGLRGVGKTTLLWQSANYIFENHHKNIFFFNVNTLKNLDVSLHTALEEFQKKVLRQKFNELQEPITLLFDEVHDDDDWSKTLKILYDEARTAFILCTGSSALLLNQTADLARRMHTEKIFPFKFVEYMAAKTYMENSGKMIFPEKGLLAHLKEALFYSKTPESAFEGMKAVESQVNNYYDELHNVKHLNIKELWQGYLSYQNIPNFLYYKDKYTINDSILSLFRRVVSEDIPKIDKSFTDYAKIERLLLRLAGSDEINTDRLGGILGMKKDEINQLIDILSKAELLNVLHSYGGLDSRILKNKKAFFMSPSLRRALLSTLYGNELPEVFRSKLLEDLVVMYLKRILIDGIISFSSGKDATNPDFIVETRDLPIILEIGTKKTSIQQITESKILRRYGVLISEGLQTVKLRENCILLPFKWFSLL